MATSPFLLHRAGESRSTRSGSRPLRTDAAGADLMQSILQCISPVDGRIYAQRSAATAAEIDAALERARAAQRSWRQVPLAERCAIIERSCDEFERRGADIAGELTWQMGRPSRFAASEVRGTLERGRYMAGI